MLLCKMELSKQIAAASVHASLSAPPPPVWKLLLLLACLTPLHILKCNLPHCPRPLIFAMLGPFLPH